MTRINLRVYNDPSQREALVGLKTPDGSFARFSALIDTGAEYSLLPDALLATADFRQTT